MTDPRAAEVAALAERYTPEMVAVPARHDRHPVRERRRARGGRARRAPRWSGSASTRSRSTGSGNILGRVGSGTTVIALDGHLDTVGVGDRLDLDARPVPGRAEGRRRLRPRRRRPGGRARGRGLRRPHRQGARAARRRAALGHRHRDGGGLRRPLLAVHPAREGARARRRRDHRADQPRRLPRPPRPDGDRGPHAGPLRATGRRPSAASTRSTRWRPSSPTSSGSTSSLAETADPFLGKGTVTIADIRSTSPSLCAVADSCTIHLDRRLTRGETLESARRRDRGAAGRGAPPARR